MKNILKISYLLVFFSITFFSCSEVNKKVDEKIERIYNKTKTIDSVLKQEIDKILTLDSLIDKEQQKILKLDSLLQKSSSKLDSIVNKFTKPQNK